MKAGNPNNGSSGFSLIEVCLALLVVGLGLLTVFSLFPSGLRSGEADSADTRAGLFSESVMAGLRANAMALTSWANWEREIAKGVLTSGGNPADMIVGSSDPQPCQFPDVPTGGSAEQEWLRYRLTLRPAMHSAFLEVWDGQYGATNTPQSTCYTEFW